MTSRSNTAAWSQVRNDVIMAAAIYANFRTFIALFLELDLTWRFKTLYGRWALYNLSFELKLFRTLTSPLSKVCGRFTYSTADTGTAHWRGLVGGGSLAPPHTFWPTASFLHVRVSGSRIRFLVVVCVVLLRLHTFSSIYAVFTVIKSEDFFINGMTRYCDKLKTVVSLNNFLLRCPSKCRK